jgi:hypothetical protein
MIRVQVSDIPTYSRTASGVIVMRASGEQKVVNFTTVAHSDEEQEPVEEEQAPTEDEQASEPNKVENNQ